MSKTKVNRLSVAGSTSRSRGRKRIVTAAWRGVRLRRWKLIVAAVVVLFAGCWMIVTYAGALDTAFPLEKKEQILAPASSTSFTTPSKEYIYAGSRLIATEEPSPCRGTPGQPRAVFDFEPDRKTEIAYYRNGVWGVLNSSRSYSFNTAQFFSWGGANLPPVYADFDGDSKEDIGYIVPPGGGQSAAYAILKSSTCYDFGQPLFLNAGFPSLGDTPVVGDFDGDHKADPAIWRATTGVWTIPKSSTNYTTYIFAQWGQSGDKAIVCDLDGDGKADMGFYRDGLWGFLKSSQGYSSSSAQFFSWGAANRQAVVGDFDGDGKSDIGCVVPESGGQSAVYAILLSSRVYGFGQGEVLYVGAGYASLGDQRVVGDYDGDGKADPGIWRPSQGIWIIPLSTTNYRTYIFSQWGQSGDTALPSKTNEY